MADICTSIRVIGLNYDVTQSFVQKGSLLKLTIFVEMKTSVSSTLIHVKQVSTVSIQKEAIIVRTVLKGTSFLAMNVSISTNVQPMVIIGRIIVSIVSLARVLTLMKVTLVNATLAMFLHKMTMICVTYKMFILKDVRLENV